jgi:hypothetical protein
MRRLMGWLLPQTAQGVSPKSLWQRLKMLSLAAFGLGMASTAVLVYLDRDRVIDELHHFGARSGLKLQDIQVRGYMTASAKLAG